MILEERDLRFDFSRALDARKFDGADHGLSHCGMKGVDFIVELPERILFIEVKDPDHPRATRKERDRFFEKVQSRTLINQDLAPKCRDSYLYEHAMARTSKPIIFIVLLSMDSLTDADLSIQTDLLQKQIPAVGPPGNPWKKRFIEDCRIFNMASWNRLMSPFPISRISESS